MALHECTTIADSCPMWAVHVHGGPFGAPGLRRSLRADVWFVRGAQVWINQSTKQSRLVLTNRAEDAKPVSPVEDGT
jgi:hypothetical protein